MFFEFMKTILKAKVIFDGKNILEANQIEIRDGIISKVGNNLNGDNLIDLGDEFLMPGMIDAHIHLSGASSGNLLNEIFSKHPEELMLNAIPWLKSLLKAGFTSVRDCGNTNSVFLREAVKNNIIPGPTIFAAGTTLSQTFGHGEFSHTIPIDIYKQMKLTEICDGIDSCIKGARTVLRRGSDFIKIFSTGGVLSHRDGPMQEQFTVDEIQSIVKEAQKAGTYVAAHAHGNVGARNAVLGGVRTLEHGTMLTEDTLNLMSERGVSLTPTLSIQTLITKYGKELGVSSWGLEKNESLHQNISKVLPTANRIGINILAGTDLGFLTGRDIDIGKNAMELILLTQVGKLSNIEALRAATGNFAKLGHRAGIIAPGYPADFVSFVGNPAEDIHEVLNVSHVFKSGKEVILN